jgi:hypothetical protein
VQKSPQNAQKAQEVTFGYLGHAGAVFAIALILETKLGTARPTKPKAQIEFP